MTDKISELKTELVKRTNLLGKELSILPYQERIIDEIIFQLEKNNPNLFPFQDNSLNCLLGKWKLIYAPNGTMFTKQLTFSPEMKVGEITQSISSSSQVNKLKIETEGIFDFSWFGDWSFKTTGVLDYKTNTQVGIVKFKEFVFSASNIFGMSECKVLSSQIPVSFFTSQGRSIVSYLDEELRIVKGISGILLVFLKESSIT